MTEPRYRVGCPGMFVLGMDISCRTEREAWATCLAGPAGSEILDTQTGKWMGVSSAEEEAEVRIEFGLPPHETDLVKAATDHLFVEQLFDRSTPKRLRPPRSQTATGGAGAENEDSAPGDSVIAQGSYTALHTKPPAAT